MLCTFTSFSVSDSFGLISIVTFRAVVAVPASRVVPAADAHSSALEAGQLKQLQVKPALPSMLVAVAY